MGVSERLNPGHIIVNNLIREGFPRERLFIVKAGSEQIEGCRCVPDIASLPERVDLFVLCIDAAQASGALVEIIEREQAESVVLIPGGLEEKAGSEAIVARMHEALARARQTAWGGPIINGGNCLGIRSLPGRYDTTFIPEYKLPVPTGAPSRLAIISQSGAFAVSKASKLGVVNPRYSITLGNQMDLTIGDYLTFLKDDPEIDVFAVYVEGFRPLDGLRFLEAARAITRSGRTVILYRAGRTAAGAKASASHTASIAGDYTVIRALSAGAGIVVAESLEDFEDLVVLFSQLGRRDGQRVAARRRVERRVRVRRDRRQPRPLHAAGVRPRERRAAARRVRPLPHRPGRRRPQPDRPDADGRRRGVRAGGRHAAARRRIRRRRGRHRAADRRAQHAGARRRPSRGLHRARRHRRAPRRACGATTASRGSRWWTPGALYDEMARALLAAGIPTFRSADRALRLFNVFCAERMRRATDDDRASPRPSAPSRRRSAA